MATRYNITSTVQRVVDGTLTPGSSASALVTNPSGTPITVYVAETGASEVTNPIATTSFGRIEGWVAVPDYNITVSGTGITTYTEYIRQSPQGTVAVEASSSINWGTGWGVSDTNLYRSAASVLKTDDTFHVTLNALMNVGAGTQVNVGDVGGSAGLAFGSAGDTNLYRSAADTLKTDDRFVPAAGILLEATTANVAFRSRQPLTNVVLQNDLLAGDANAAFRILGSGSMAWGAGGASTVDTTLYRTSAGLLTTDGSFQTGTSLVAGTEVIARSGLSSQVSIGIVGSNPGVLLGSAGDTNLYREGTNILATDDKLHVVGEIELDGALNHDGSTVGFYGVTPVTRATTYTVTNGVTDRTYDANNTTVHELADVLATVIADLKLTGLFG